MVQMAVKRILFEYDEPLVLEATDLKGRRYVCLNINDTKNGNLYLVTYVEDGYYNNFLNQEVDLRFLIRDGAKGVYRTAEFYGEEGEKFNAKPFRQPIDQLLPKPGFFLPSAKLGVKESNREIRSITIDGKWGIDDLNHFPGLIQDTYAFVYSLKSDDPGVRSKLRLLFTKYPWRGGFSTINFFNDIYYAIPRQDAARIASMRYSSLGDIQVEVNKDVADYVGTVIADMVESNKIHELYRDIYNDLKEKRWLGRSSGDVRLTTSEKNYLRRRIREFSSALMLEDRVGHVLYLSEGDPLASIKILLSFYRKMEKLDHYVRTGKARDVFVQRDAD